MLCFVPGQNFFFNSDNRQQQARFIPSFQQNQFTGSQQPFVNYFPQTNAGPFLPFRSSDFRLQNSQVNGDSNTLASNNKFQRQQQFSSPSFNADPSSDPRFDSLISSPGSFTSNGEDYTDTNFHDATADVQPQSRFTQTDNRQPIQFRNNQIARFPPVAISEVTRSQDSPNSPNVLQTHSFVNVHHTTRHPEELPLAQSNRWRSSVPQDDFSFRPRNVPFQQFTSGKPAVTEASPTEDVFAKFNRFGPKEQTFLVATPESSPAQIFEHQPTAQVIRHDGHFNQPVDKKEVQIKPAKNNRVKTNSNIAPTTYSPPILLDNRIRNTPSTSTQSTAEPVSDISKAQILARNNAQGIRGRNKFSRPPPTSEVEKTTKPANKLKTTSNLQTRSPSSTTSRAEFRDDENDNFEVVTMSQDHLFVSEDNFRGWLIEIFIRLAKGFLFFAHPVYTYCFHDECYQRCFNSLFIEFSPTRSFFRFSFLLLGNSKRNHSKITKPFVQLSTLVSNEFLNYTANTPLRVYFFIGNLIKNTMNLYFAVRNKVHLSRLTELKKQENIL